MIEYDKIPHNFEIAEPSEDFPFNPANTYPESDSVDLYINGNYYKSIFLSNLMDGYTEYIFGPIRPYANFFDSSYSSLGENKKITFTINKYAYGSDSRIVLECNDPTIKIGKAGLYKITEEKKEDFLKGNRKEEYNRFDIMDFG